MAAAIMISFHLLQLMLSCFLGAASVRTMKGGSGRVQDQSFSQSSSYPVSEGRDKDMLSQHMSKLYERYNREPRLRDGNTVRSFRANQESSDRRTVYQLNLTTLQDSEVILSATFHFLLDRRPHQKSWSCKRFKSSSCRSTGVHPSPPISLLLRSISSRSEVSSGSVGSLLGNLTFHPHRRGVWQMKDVTQVIKEARNKGHLFVSAELDWLQDQDKPDEVLSAGSRPYILLYAYDQALVEPNSVAASLQRYDPFNEEGEPTHSSRSSHLLHRPNSSPELKGRVRREAALLSDPIENNELPEVDYRPDGYRKDDLWESTWYLTLKPKGPESEKKGNKRKDQEEERAPVLSFDEQTMRKARRRQWNDNQHKGCARRNLRVDFADIGWSEWVIAPKAFDAYYCAGTCGFPMPKVSRPSNHATIRVPEKMSPLAVLYQDESRNPVLKVYPNMSVQSCSCR
uniref:Growth/differentiation factor 10 n=1 Tax=Mola mola TaxID=94237 RepID=A0A3Q3WBH2_MOLML